MSSITVYFHALPEEQLKILRQWLPAHRDILVVVMYWSREFKLIEQGSNPSFEGLLETYGIPNRICLGFEPPKTKAETGYEFLRDNDNWTAWDIGEFNSEGLRESHFSASTDNAVQQKTWASLATQIKKATTAGWWVVNPQTGGKQFYKQCRFSPGAAEIAQSGKKLLPVAGWNYYQIEET